MTRWRAAILSGLFTDAGRPVFADTSALINLHASQVADRLVSAIPNRVIVTQNAVEELERGRLRGYSNAEQLADSVQQGILTIESLSGHSLEIWESLITGSAADTLDDGEAATLALAAVRNGIALIDERKARRIALDRFPQVEVLSSVDLFVHPATLALLGESGQVDAILRAILDARMYVPYHLMSIVMAILGPDKLSSCGSLPRAIREESS
jgi:predicted nucleic acid-binding protein